MPILPRARVDVYYAGTEQTGTPAIQFEMPLRDDTSFEDLRGVAHERWWPATTKPETRSRPLFTKSCLPMAKSLPSFPTLSSLCIRRRSKRRRPSRSS